MGSLFEHEVWCTFAVDSDSRVSLDNDGAHLSLGLEWAGQENSVILVELSHELHDTVDALNLLKELEKADLGDVSFVEQWLLLFRV